MNPVKLTPLNLILLTHPRSPSDLSSFLTRQHLFALNRYIRMKEALRLETNSDEEEVEEDEEEEENEAQEKVWRTSLTDDDMWWMDSKVDKEFTGDARPLKREGFPVLNQGKPSVHRDTRYTLRCDERVR